MRKFRLLSVLFSVLLCAAPTLADPMKYFPPNALPEGTYIYGGYDINTGEFGFGVSPKRNGGHYMVANRLRGGAPIPAPGEGSVVGFGVYRDGNYLYVGPGSCKAAGGTAGGLNTVNPLLPRTNPAWGALVPEEYAPELLSALVDQTGLQLQLDNDLFNSARFPFHAGKHDPFTYKYAMDQGTYWLARRVHEANMRLPGYHHAAGYYTPDILAYAPDETLILDGSWGQKYPKNMADGYLEAINRYHPDWNKPKPPATPYRDMGRDMLKGGCRFAKEGAAFAAAEAAIEIGLHGASYGSSILPHQAWELSDQMNAQRDKRLTEEYGDSNGTVYWEDLPWYKIFWSGQEKLRYPRRNP